MSEHNQDESFEQDLMELLPEQLPENVSQEVNPWYNPIMKIVWGLGLTSILLHFFNLDTILPAIGWLLLLLGFRAFRRENNWFRLAWIVSLIGMSTKLLHIILNGTIWAGVVYASPIYAPIPKIILSLQPVLDFALWMGLRSVRRQAGLKPGTGAVLALLCWHLVILAIGLFWGKLDAIPLMIVLLAAYIGILICINKISKSLHLAGYGLRDAPVHMSDGILASVVTGFAVAGVLCGLLFCQQYPMNWMPVQNEENQQVQQVKAELLAIGFPEPVLQDLTDEDVLALQGATRVVSGTDVHPVNEGREEKWQEEDGNWGIGPVYDKKELRISGVAVLLPGEREQWQIIHHFRWEEQPKFFGTESIRLIPTDHNIDGWMRNGDLTGRLLCEKNEETLEAPFWFLGEKEAIHGGMLWDLTTETDIFAAFSLPKQAQHQRGYISYSVSELEDGCIIFSWFDYTHRDSPLVYPNQSALDHQISGVWDLKHRFPNIQTAVELNPNLDGNVLSGYEETGS